MTEQEIMKLSSDALDDAVAIAQGFEKKDWAYTWWDNKKGDIIEYHPSTNGSQCMEIMEREKIGVAPCANNLWEAEKVINSLKYYSEIFISAEGKTPQEAILRCFLLSKQ